MEQPIEEKYAPIEEEPNHNRCFTYPQGQASILPTILTLMAALAGLLVWPWLGYSDNFGCSEYSVSGSSASACSPLYLNTPDFWSDASTDGWARALQAAAVFAIFSSAIGFVAFSLLITATCFELEARKILTIMSLQGTAACCSILTLIAGAADVCKANGYTNDTCSNGDFQVDTGAGFEIFAYLIYLVAIAFTYLWYKQVCPRREPKQQGHAASMAGSSAARRASSVTITQLPNGDKRTERVYVDETGQSVTEVTVERGSNTVDYGDDLEDATF